MVIESHIQFLNSGLVEWLEYSLVITADASFFFEYIMIRKEQDIPNWILEDSGHFTLKSAMTFFLDPEIPCDWDKLI